jgi:hypothetical protein
MSPLAWVIDRLNQHFPGRFALAEDCVQAIKQPSGCFFHAENISESPY